MPINLISDSHISAAAQALAAWAVREDRVRGKIGGALHEYAGGQRPESAGLRYLLLGLCGCAVYSGDEKVAAAARAIQNAARRFAAPATFADYVRASISFLATEHGILLEIDDARTVFFKEREMLKHLNLLLQDAMERGAGKIRLSLADGGVEIADDGLRREASLPAVFVDAIYAPDVRDMARKINDAAGMHEWLCVARHVIGLAWTRAQEFFVKWWNDPTEINGEWRNLPEVKEISAHWRMLVGKADKLMREMPGDLRENFFDLKRFADEAVYSPFRAMGFYDGVADAHVPPQGIAGEIMHANANFFRERLLSIDLSRHLAAAYQGRKWPGREGGVVTTFVTVPQNRVYSKPEEIMRAVGSLAGSAIARHPKGEAVVRIDLVSGEGGQSFVLISDHVSKRGEEIFHAAVRVNDGGVSATSLSHDSSEEFKNRMRLSFDPTGGRLVDALVQGEEGERKGFVPDANDVMEQLPLGNRRREIALAACGLWGSLPVLHPIFPPQGAALNPDFLGLASAAVVAPMPFRAMPPTGLF